MLIVLFMLVLGILFGFIGAGGAGFVLAVLTTIFKIPIHIALATSLTAMIFTSMSGAYSHYREGNTHIKIGVIVGIFAAFGAFFGAKISSIIPAQSLQWMTATMLFLSALLLLLKFSILTDNPIEELDTQKIMTWLKAILLGILSGILSGTFGIGAAPFIQIGLLVLLKLSIRQSVGTTMLVTIPLAIGGGIGFHSEGFINYLLLFQVLIGTVCGAFIGAKFTGILPKNVLKTSIILTPTTAGIILLM